MILLACVVRSSNGTSLSKCITEDGKELTRVCVIDFTSGIVIYDQLVKPTKPILDYLTRFVFTLSSILILTRGTSNAKPHLFL